MIQRTFFNSRKERLYWNYTDTNSYLFTIIFNSDAELNLILRNLKKDNNVVNYIYNKLNNKFINIFEIEISNISLEEYNLLKQEKVPSVIKIC
jgi:hypothetical protein|tara:strand:- start:3957 stop:4235 length:279 start_codon:yes stop_codon:yes gene_type:complete